MNNQIQKMCPLTDSICKGINCQWYSTTFEKCAIIILAHGSQDIAGELMDICVELIGLNKRKE